MMILTWCTNCRLSQYRNIGKVGQCRECATALPEYDTPVLVECELVERADMEKRFELRLTATAGIHRPSADAIRRVPSG